MFEDVTRLPGFVAEAPTGDPIGFALLHFEETMCRCFRASKQHGGVGTALLEAGARERSRRRLPAHLAVTTQPQIFSALRFYQRRGWDWIAMHRDAVVEGRRLKPEISPLGEHDIPIRHELGFQLALDVRQHEP